MLGSTKKNREGNHHNEHVFQNKDDEAHCMHDSINWLQRKKRIKWQKWGGPQALNWSERG